MTCVVVLLSFVFLFLTLCSEGSKGGRGGGEEDEEQRRCEKQLPNTVGGGEE